MKTLVLLALCCVGLQAQDLKFTIHDDATNSDTPLPSTYPFRDTPQGESSSIKIRIADSKSNPIEIIGVVVFPNVDYPNYRIYGSGTDRTLVPKSPRSFKEFTLYFTPSTTGQLVGYLQVSYAVKQGGCLFADDPQSSPPSPICTSSLIPVATLQGSGTAPRWLLTYTSDGGVKGTPQLDSILVLSLLPTREHFYSP